MKLKLLMSNNENIVDVFKRTLSSTVRSISRLKDTDIKFVTDKPCIDGNEVNLTLPSKSLIKNDLNYLRGEADSFALKLRLHNQKLHQKYITGNKSIDKIINAIEQSRCDSIGSNIYPGVKNNIIVKFNKELKESISEKDQEENLYLGL